MRFGKKLDKFIWFWVYTLPFWIAGYIAIANAGATNGTTWDTFINGMTSFLPQSGTLYTTIESIFEYFITECTAITILSGFTTYIIIAHFAHVIELILVFFVHITEKLIDRAKGRQDE